MAAADPRKRRRGGSRHVEYEFSPKPDLSAPPLELWCLITRQGHVRGTFLSAKEARAEKISGDQVVRYVIGSGGGTP